MKPNSVVFANAGGGSDRFRALLAGVVKATASSSEFEPEAEKRGFTILARANAMAPNFARNCIVTTDKILATRHDAVVRFLAANIEGTAYAMSHRAETVALSRSAAKLSPDDTSPEFIFDEATAQKNIDPNLAIPTDKLQWIESVLAKNDTVDDNADVKAFIDDAPRQAALKLVKP
jgi:NitT/TauT family transport system substrate-binding protein